MLAIIVIFIVFMIAVKTGRATKPGSEPQLRARKPGAMEADYVDW